MELLQIILYLAAAAAVVVAYGFAMGALNARCSEKYDYEPVTISKFGFIVVACFFLFVGALSGNDNFYVAVAFASLVVLAIWGRIYSKTSFLDSLAAMGLLLLGGVVVFLLLLAIWLNSGDRRDNQRQSG